MAFSTGSRALLQASMRPFVRVKAFLVYFHHSYLPDILELTLVHYSEGQLAVLETKGLVILHGLHLLAEEINSELWVGSDLLR